MIKKDSLNKFKRYTNVAFKYVFIVFFFFTTLRVFLLFANDDAESVTLFSILLGYSIVFFGSLFMAMLGAAIAVYKEDYQ
jgi:hypothetical protein